MKVIIAGSRTIKPSALDIRFAIQESQFDVNEIVSGTAIGADKAGEQYAIDEAIDLVMMPANWTKYKKSAGYARNLKMANYADALIAFWDGQSKGTAHIIEIMQKLKKPVKVIIIL
jgi:hypothetical protein